MSFNRSRISLIVGLALFVATTLGSVVGAESSITIDTPHEGDTVVNTNSQFSGSAAADSLVKISVIDIDGSRSDIAHQVNGRVEGNITSDKNGEWIFVPQEKLTPGEFSIQASYTDKSSGSTVNSKVVRFIVVDSQGNSSLPSNELKIQIGLIIAGVIIVLAVISYFVFRSRRRGRESNDMAMSSPQLSRHSFLRHPLSTSLFAQTKEGQQYAAQEAERIKQLDSESIKVERDLALVAKELEETNQEVITLREQLESDKPDDEPEIADIAASAVTHNNKSKH